MVNDVILFHDEHTHSHLYVYIVVEFVIYSV